MNKRQIAPLKRPLEWHKYSEFEIEKYCPTDPGIYFIVREYYGKSAVWVYVGQAEDIRDRLLKHCKGISDESSWINTSKPTTFGVIAPISGGEKRRRAIEQRFIDKLKPICNFPMKKEKKTEKV